MAAKIRRWIDPKTGDYVVESGGLRGDSGFTSKAVLALRTRRGSCQVLPAFGSRLHEVRTWDEIGRRLAEKYALEAVEHLADEVEGLTATARLGSRPGEIEIEVSARSGTQQLRARYTATAKATA